MSEFVLRTVSMPVFSSMPGCQGQQVGTSTKRVGPRPGSRSKKMTHVYEYVTNLEFCNGEFLADLAEKVDEWIGLYGDEAEIDIEVEDGYNGCQGRRYIKYWRPMTKEEIAAHKEQQTAAQARLLRDEEMKSAAALRRLREEHPEWLTEEKRADPKPPDGMTAFVMFSGEGLRTRSTGWSR